MNKKILSLVVIIAALGIGGYVVFMSPRVPAPVSQEKLTGARDGWYQIIYTGECNQSPKERSPIFSGVKVLHVLNNEIVEVDGATNLSSVITNDKATVILNPTNDNQETDVFIFSHREDGRKTVTVSFQTTAGCYGTGTGKEEW